jgi:hypothetical protein
METAASNILPALFGVILVNILGSGIGGGIKTQGRLFGMIPPLIIVVLLTVFDAQISSFLHLDQLLGQEGEGVIMSVFRGFVIISILPVTYFGTKLLYKKGKIKVLLPNEASKE